jgi:hypothetical protein
MDNTEKLATLGIQDLEGKQTKQMKNTTQKIERLATRTPT